jgi:hypothetical protein
MSLKMHHILLIVGLACPLLGYWHADLQPEESSNSHNKQG